MGSRSRHALRGKKMTFQAADLSQEHVGKFVRMVYSWEWEFFDETIEGILVSSKRVENYYHVIEIATEKDRTDFVTGRGVWSEQVEVFDEMPEEWKPLSRKLEKLKRQKAEDQSK
jgi:hypothetical protein